MSIHEPPAGASIPTLLEWVFDRINDHDIPSLRKAWTPQTRLYFPDEHCVGDEQIARYFAGKIAAIEGFRMEVVSIAATGSDGYVHWRMTGTHVGNLVGIAATGRQISLDGMDHFVIEDGKVVDNTVVFDQLEFARQVGLVPADGSAPDRLMKGAFNLATRARKRFAKR